MFRARARAVWRFLGLGHDWLQQIAGRARSRRWQCSGNFCEHPAQRVFQKTLRRSILFTEEADFRDTKLFEFLFWLKSRHAYSCEMKHPAKSGIPGTPAGTTNPP